MFIPGWAIRLPSVRVLPVQGSICYWSCVRCIALTNEFISLRVFIFVNIIYATVSDLASKTKKINFKFKVFPCRKPWLFRSLDFSGVYCTVVRLQNLPWYKTGLVSRQVLHPLSKLQNWIWPKTGRYKTGLVSNTKIEASIRTTKPKPWQSHLTSDTVEIFIQNEKASLVPMQSRFRSRHKAGFGAAGLAQAQSRFRSRHKAGFGAVGLS